MKESKEGGEKEILEDKDEGGGRGDKELEEVKNWVEEE